MGKLNHWTQDEDDLIKVCFHQFQSRKWKNISKLLEDKGFKRGEAQCRQRYVNHLDPILNKNPDIELKQLQILYGKYEIHGPKWCLIQTFLPNRTQIRIKNIFYGNIRLFLKKLYKFFTKKTAVFINDLKTDDLQSIYDGSQEFQGFNLMKKAFRSFHYMINQQNCNSIIQSNQRQYFELLNKILEFKTKIKPIVKKGIIQQKEEVVVNKKQFNQNIQIKNLSLKNGQQLLQTQYMKINSNIASENLNLKTDNTVVPIQYSQRSEKNDNQSTQIVNFPISSNLFNLNMPNQFCIQNANGTLVTSQLHNGFNCLGMQLIPMFNQPFFLNNSLFQFQR